MKGRRLLTEGPVIPSASELCSASPTEYFVDASMPRERDSSIGRGAKKGTYVQTTSVLEDNSSEPQPTYAVQFAWKPCKYYMEGGGSIWKGRGPLKPDRMNGHSKPNMIIDDSESDPDESDVIDADEPPENSRWRNLFVTVNLNTVRVYEARKRQKPLLLQRYEDEDDQEQFYCVSWTFNADGHNEWWVCAAGKKGVLRIINVQRNKPQRALAGHGEAINDLRVHPRDPALVITASKDESLRLWNLRTGSTIALFAGLKGHRGEVVHVDFYRDGSKFASCGIDNSVRLWDVYDDEKVVESIVESHKAADLGVTDMFSYIDETSTRRKGKVPISQFPFFVTRKVHKHYVDCVMWVGDLLLSKSVHNRMFLWEPEQDRESLASPATEYTLLEEYVLDVCNVWFIRFAMDRNRRLVACGNDKVRIKCLVRISHVPRRRPVLKSCSD